MINGTVPSECPDIDQTPVNEFKTPFLATMDFPTLFPYGHGDPTYGGRQRAVSLTDGLKHLIKYAEITKDNQRYWHFASHPRFPYWGRNMKQRHQVLSQANVYLQKHPEDANLTTENMKTMIGQLSAEQLMKTSALCCQSTGIFPILVSALSGTTSLVRTEGLTHFFLDS